MKLQNVLKGVAYIAAIAVSVLFYVQSKNVVAQYNALSTPAVQTQLPAPAPQPTVDPQTVATRQYEAMQRQERAQASAAQAARIKAELEKVALPKPKPKPTPQPAYSFAAPGPELMPLEGWVDQPNKDRPGRVHTELMVRHVKPSAKPRTPGRAPCLVMTAKPAQRIEREYGWLEVPARTIPVPCGP